MGGEGGVDVDPPIVERLVVVLLVVVLVVLEDDVSRLLPVLRAILKKGLASVLPLDFDFGIEDCFLCFIEID